MKRYILLSSIINDISAEKNKYNVKGAFHQGIRCGLKKAMKIIHDQPKVNTENISKYATWELDPILKTRYRCSHCHELTYKDKHKNYLTKYCHECGYMMLNGM